MDFPFEVGDAAIETRMGQRIAMVLAPKRTIRMGAQQIEHLRGEPTIGPMDRWIIEAAEARPKAELLVFRARSTDGSATWGFDETLDESELDELGYLLLRAQVPVYRRLMAAGLHLVVHVEWSPRDRAAVEDGRDRLLSELAKMDDGDSTARVDEWILRNLSFFFALSFDHVIDRVLPEKLPLLERRQTRLRELVRALPEASLA